MSNALSLGTIIKRLRKERRMTLAEMSTLCGIPLSTLSKIENDKLTLTYDKMQQVSRSLNVPLSSFFSEEGPARDATVTARRSLASLDTAVRVETPNYVYNYFCSDLRKRLMIPIHTTITATSLEEFGDLVRHPGEEFVYVLDGAIEVHTEYYAPMVLQQGEGTYIDSNMGHAYIVAAGFSTATMLAVCASPADDLEQHLIAEAEGRTQASLPQPSEPMAPSHPVVQPVVEKRKRTVRRKAA